jgi:type I restriction enzyme S subunit
MIADLKPYPEYKESGLPWLGRVPGHWEMRPAFGVFVPNYERNHGMKEKTVLSLSYGRIIIKPAEKLHGLVPESFETYQIVNPGDIVLRTTDLQNDHTSLRIGMVRDRGIITSAYLSLRLNAEVIPDFGFQFLNVWDTSKAIYGYGSGLRQNLDFSHFKRMPVAVPPPDEQEAIVRFLDWANGRLDRAIKAKRKVIALLNEQKQAIIHRAVTRGLDPSVPLKPSGIPWLGDIPQHWEVTALRRHWRVTDCKHLTVPFVDEGIPLASVVEVQPFSLNLNRCKRTKTEWYWLLIEGGRKPKRGDLIYCRNVSVGACALVETDIDFAMGQDVCLIRSNTQNQRFLNYVLHSPFMVHQLALILVGSTFKRINISEIKSLAVIVPPRQEQDIICEFLDADMVNYDATISRLEREIDLLREYRTRLVADVVTGKLDVREAAARLPEEAVESLTESEIDWLDDDTEIDPTVSEEAP